MIKLSAGKSFVIATLLLAAGPAAAQEEEETGEEESAGMMAPAPVAEEEVAAATPTLPEVSASSLAPTVSGFVAGTYNYNVMDPSSGATPFHSFTAAHNSFLLNTAHLAIAGSDDHLSYLVEIDGGTDAPATSPLLVQEAWLAYAADSGMGFKAGKFVTFQGIEVIESPLNPTISRGFLFGLAEPFSHVGALFTYKASDTLDFAAGVVNGWDVEADTNQMKTFVGKVGITQEKLAVTGSVTVGPEQPGNDDDYRISGDVTAVLKGDAMDIWLQANGGFEQTPGDAVTWFGATVQPVYRMSDDLVLGARAEIFLDPDGARTAVMGGVTLVNVSATPAFKIHEHVWIRAEARLDFATEDVLGDGDAIQVVGLTEAYVTF